MKQIDLRLYIRDVADFPKKGIIFKDVSPLLENAEAFQYAISLLSQSIGKVDHIVGLDARGFIFGSAIAYELGIPFSMIRKAGKLPYKTFHESYSLEYGTNIFELHTDSIRGGSKVAIVDDLLATGGSAEAACKLIKKSGGIVASLHFLLELDFLDGRKKLDGYEITSLLHF